MHDRATVETALKLHEAGLNNSEISRRTGVSRPTIRDWLRGRLPHSYRAWASGQKGCPRCGAAEHRFDRLGPDYVYLLGLYLGDGSIAEHRRQHDRHIYLAGWQRKLTERWPERLLRGLIHSDGCRSYSTGGKSWTQPRYVFSNVSTDITSIFCSACDCLELRWTAAFPKDESKAVSIYVSRKADVARLDGLVGPKR